MNPKLTWYVARTSGLVSWWLVALAVFWGLLLSTRVLQGRPKPAWLLDLHRWLAALSVTFVAIHIGALAADKWVHFGLTELFVPMASKWRPGAVAWGIVSIYVLIAIEVSSLFMKKIPRKWWKAIHSTSFLLFVSSTVHAFTAGADHNNRAVQWSALAMFGMFIFLTSYKQLAPRRGRGRAATAIDDVVANQPVAVS